MLLVGGEEVISPDPLLSASKIITPKFAEVGSAIIDTVKSTESNTTAQILEEISAEAVDRAVAPC